MKISLLKIFAVLTFFISFNLYAQFAGENPLAPEEAGSKILIGPVFGYNSVMHSADKLATFAGDAYCPYFDGGTGQGFFAGLTYEMPFGKAEESVSSLIFKVLYSTYPGNMDIPGDEFPSLVPDPESGTDVTVIRTATNHTIDISYSVVALEVMYKQNLSVDIPLGVVAGPTIEIPIQKDVLQEFHLIADNNIQFSEVPGYNYSADRRTVILKDGPMDNANGIRLGLKVGIQYELIPMEGWLLVPHISYNFSILNVKSDEDYRINLIQVGADLRYAF